MTTEIVMCPIHNRLETQAERDAEVAKRIVLVEVSVLVDEPMSAEDAQKDAQAYVDKLVRGQQRVLAVDAVASLPH